MTDVVAAAVATDTATAAPVGEGAPKKRKKRLGKLGFGGWVSLIWLAIVAIGAITAPYLPLRKPQDPDFLVPANANPGTGGHLLGTDQNGYDLFSRLVWGGRVSLIIGIGVLIAGMMVGGTIGLIAGFLRGRSESLL